RYDVIVIGTGAGGGTLAHALAPSGARILLLERGDFLPRERDNWNSEAVFVANKYKAQETWYDKHGKAFHPGIHYCVGGNTKFYGAVLLRMREGDFGEVRHEDGTSPRWPLSYADFAPWYRQAEVLYHVHGQRGADPTEPPDPSPYPYPPVSHEPRVQELADDLKRAGLKPFPLPLGVRLDESDVPHSSCIRCDTCDGFPCLVSAKSDAHVTCVRPALAHPNVTLMTNATVERLDTTASGREVSRVVVSQGGTRRQFAADIVVVSCGAINSAALLLRSASEQHSNGLGNRSDTVGHIQMLGKTDAAMFKGETHGLLPRRALDELARHSLDFWLTGEDLPRPDNRITLASEGLQISYTPTNQEAHQRLTDKLRG